MLRMNELQWQPEIQPAYSEKAELVIAHGDCVDILKSVPDNSIKLVITSPPYNLGKSYESSTDLANYLEALDPIVVELIRVLSPEGSLCWQVGNYVEKSEVFPLDIFYYPYFKRRGLKLRNRIIW